MPQRIITILFIYHSCVFLFFLLSLFFWGEGGGGGGGGKVPAVECNEKPIKPLSIGCQQAHETFKSKLMFACVMIVFFTAVLCVTKTQKRL